MSQTIVHSEGTHQRGDRLSPSRSSRVYWHLTCLRREVEAVIASHILEKRFSRLVDYGCGNMPYRPLFEPHVKEYLGVDFSGNALADRSLEHTGALPFDSESVDVVLSSQVLEHVSDPSAYLMEAYRVLGQEGRLILSTHGLWKYHPDPTDFWRWTCDGLRREIGRAGFEIVQFRGVMGPAATALQLWQDAVLHNVPRPFLTLFTRCMQLLIRRADIRCLDKNRDRDACVYVLVAKKKP